VVRTEDELHAVLGSLEEQAVKYAPRREQFTADFGEYDTGTAARSVVDQFFAQWRRG
jgi:CDP-glycerol glycerophosphotransferase